jgi:nucleoside 2-deoxyribosyltransferase
MIEIIGNKKYKKVYLSGPITGIANGNIIEFQKYEDKFVGLNFEVVNPHKLHTKEETDNFKWHEFMKKDIKVLCECDFIAVLNDWEKSKGANLEVYIARNIQMPIICAVTLKELF